MNSPDITYFIFEQKDLVVTSWHFARRVVRDNMCIDLLRTPSLIVRASRKRWHKDCSIVWDWKRVPGFRRWLWNRITVPSKTGCMLLYMFLSFCTPTIYLDRRGVVESHGFHLLTFLSRVRFPLWQHFHDSLQRHQVLVLFRTRTRGLGFRLN